MVTVESDVLLVDRRTIVFGALYAESTISVGVEDRDQNEMETVEQLYLLVMTRSQVTLKVNGYI